VRLAEMSSREAAKENRMRRLCVRGAGGRDSAGWGRRIKMNKVVLAILTLSSPVVAQELKPELRIENAPATGVVQTVSVGTQIHEYQRLYSYNATIPETQMKGGQWFLPLIVEPDTPMFPVSTKAKFKACVQSGPCALDDDGDGIFDRMASDEISIALRLKIKVPYRTKRVTIEAPDSLRQVILYQGSTADTLRLSYREFSNNMARSAFTEELVLPIAKIFPQDVAVKAVKFRIYSIDGLGMKYEILP
jgi:hypothetical protein